MKWQLHRVCAGKRWEICTHTQKKILLPLRKRTSVQDLRGIARKSLSVHVGKDT